MRAVAIALVGSALAAVGAPAAGQHLGAAVTGECETCHTTHADAPREFLLKVADPQPWASLRGDLDVGSASCLRCHGDDRTRARQPEFQGYAPVPAGGRTYLGFDLSDDHLVGSGTLWLRRDVAARGRSLRRRLTPGGVREVEARGVTCTTCHDPHARQGPLLGPDAEAGLCSRCHDLSGYGGGHQGVQCSACHQLHGGDPTGLLRGRGTDDACRSCHDARGGTSRAGARGLTVPASLAHVGEARPLVGRCVDCHAVHR